MFFGLDLKLRDIVQNINERYRLGPHFYQLRCFLEIGFGVQPYNLFSARLFKKFCDYTAIVLRKALIFTARLWAYTMVMRMIVGSGNHALLLHYPLHWCMHSHRFLNRRFLYCITPRFEILKTSQHDKFKGDI